MTTLLNNQMQVKKIEFLGPEAEGVNEILYFTISIKGDRFRAQVVVPWSVLDQAIYDPVRKIEKLVKDGSDRLRALPIEEFEPVLD